MHPAGLEPANCPIMSWVLLPLSHGCFFLYRRYILPKRQKDMSTNCVPIGFVHRKKGIDILTNLIKHHLFSD